MKSLIWRKIRWCVRLLDCISDVAELFFLGCLRGTFRPYGRIEQYVRRRPGTISFISPPISFFWRHCVFSGVNVARSKTPRSRWWATWLNLAIYVLRGWAYKKPQRRINGLSPKSNLFETLYFSNVVQVSDRPDRFRSCRSSPDNSDHLWPVWLLASWRVHALPESLGWKSVLRIYNAHRH